MISDASRAAIIAALGTATTRGGALDGGIPVGPLDVTLAIAVDWRGTTAIIYASQPAVAVMPDGPMVPASPPRFVAHLHHPSSGVDAADFAAQVENLLRESWAGEVLS